MSARRKVAPPTTESAAALAGACGAGTYDISNTVNDADDPRSNQGIAPARHQDQRPPTWNLPRGSVAAADLESALAGWTALLGRRPNIIGGRK